MSVDVDTSWIVEPADRGSRVTLGFDGAVRMGVIGRAMLRIVVRPARLRANLGADARELGG